MSTRFCDATIHTYTAGYLDRNKQFKFICNLLRKRIASELKQQQLETSSLQPSTRVNSIYKVQKMENVLLN